MLHLVQVNDEGARDPGAWQATGQGPRLRSRLRAAGAAVRASW